MLVVERSPRHIPTHLRNLAMNRRMWHRDDPCIVVSGKAFVEEIDSASSSVLFPRYRSRWRGTFPDALITSPTGFLDVEACIPSAASSLGPSFARLRDVRPCAAQAWSDHDALCCGRRRAGPSNEGCNDRVVPALCVTGAEVSKVSRSRMLKDCAAQTFVSCEQG